MVTNQKLEFKEGDDFSYLLTITDSDGVVDVTGYTFYFTVKQNKSDIDANAIFKKVVTSLSDPTNGEVLITIDSADTDGKNIGTNFYEIKWTDTSDDIKTIMEGSFIISKALTDSVA